MTRRSHAPDVFRGMFPHRHTLFRQVDLHRQRAEVRVESTGGAGGSSSTAEPRGVLRRGRAVSKKHARHRDQSPSPSL